jgi:hypothetical protein
MKFWKLLLLLALACQASGCAHWVELRLPKEYQDKKLTEDPPGYAQDDKSILDNQK